MTLIVEIRAPEGWRRLGQRDASDRPGSVSNNTPDGRHIIRFTDHGDHALIQRSIGGVDFRQQKQRVLLSTGFELLARLDPGQSYETTVQTDGMTKPAPIRWRKT